MSRTLLELCSDVVSDLGVAGGTIQSVVGTSLNNEQRSIVRWVKKADLFVQLLWADWRFLWYQDTAFTVLAGTNTGQPTLPSWAQSVRNYDRESMWQGYGTGMASPVPYMPWQRMVQLYLSKPLTAAVTPNFWSIDPQGNVRYSQLVLADTVFTVAYHVSAKPMASNTDRSPIPTDFDGIIVERAKIFYAEREASGEILSGSTAEYTDLLDKMQAYCLPDNVAGRTSQNNPSTMPSAYVE